MKTTAKEIQCASKAGLVLCGQNYFDFPEYIGSNRDWREYEELLNYVDENGIYLWQT